MTSTGRKRPWLAALLSLVYPGLGHLYLRSWIRSVLWFGLVVSAVVLLVPASAIEPADGTVATMTAAWEALEGLSFRTKALLSGLVLMEAFDAYMLALRDRTPRTGDGCPHCGKELDEDLEFCHWCSASLGE